MNKPAKPVSLAPVKALSTPAPVAQPALAKVAETPVEKPFAAQAESAQPQAVAAPRVEAPKPEAATVEATRPEVPKAESPRPQADRPQADRPQADRPQAYKPAAGMPEAGKLEERPAAGTVAAPAPPSVVSITPASAPAKPAEKAAVQMPAPRAIVARPAAAKSASSKPAAAKSAAAKSGPAKPAAAKSGPAPKAAGKIADAAPANPLSALGSLFSMPGLSPGFVPPALAATEFPVPAFSADMMAEFASRWLDAARTLGTVQARLLDHGVRQLKAGMAEFEACARSSHPSELVVIQARALRRSSDDLTDTIKAVSDTARKSAAPR
jgi:hypothetical protein